MSRIILITYIDDKTNKLIISHGIDEDTFKNVVLPQEHPRHLGAFLDMDIGEWVIPNKS